MSDREKRNLNNDFNVAKEAAEKQKVREAEMRELLTAQQKQRDEQRQAKIDQIKDDKARQDLTLRMASDDKNATDQLDRLKEKQQAEINKQANKEVNKQGNPVLDMMNMSGRSPQAIHDKVTAQLKPMHEREQATLVRGLHDMMRGSIDKEIQKHVEREQAQEEQRKRQIENRTPDQVFEKPAEERTSKDAFTLAHDRKDDTKTWRQLRDERQADERER